MPVGRTVAVVGAGNTAIDAVTQARRLGAERVLMVYRRTEREMPAYRYEYELAKQDAVEFWWQTAPVAVVADAAGARVAALRCVRMELGEPDASRRRAAHARRRLGVRHPRRHGHQGARPAEAARLLREHRRASNSTPRAASTLTRETMQTANPKFFAGGDCVNGGREAVDASQMGKLAAQGIHWR